MIKLNRDFKMRKLGILFAAYLTIGTNHNLMLGNGNSLGLDIEQPLTHSLSLNPSVSIDNNTGFRERFANVDLDLAVTPHLTLIMGAGYDKYTLTSVEPTEDSNVHTAVKIKLW